MGLPSRGNQNKYTDIPDLSKGIGLFFIPIFVHMTVTYHNTLPSGSAAPQGRGACGASAT